MHITSDIFSIFHAMLLFILFLLIVSALVFGQCHRQIRVKMPETAENIKKVAVVMDGQQTQFLELDQVIIFTFKVLWNIWFVLNVNR